MKKLIICLMFLCWPVLAEEITCPVKPSCESMGFNQTVKRCHVLSILRCPFDVTNDNAVFCGDGACSEEFTLDECPEGGTCAECGDIKRLDACVDGYIMDTDTDNCCSTTDYIFDVCPDNGNCSYCGGKQKFESCNTGYTKAENTCCSDEYYNLNDKPDNATVEQCGNKYHFVGCSTGYIEQNGQCIRSAKTCALGDIVYSDLKCYETAPTDLTAIAVVFDVNNKLAIGLTQASSTLIWANTATNISGLTNCTSSNATMACDPNGKANSNVINALGSNYTGTSYAPGYCYNQTTGGLAQGTWFLPSASELYTLYLNKSKVSTGITSASGTALTSSYYYSSTEYSSSGAFRVSLSSGSASSGTKRSTKAYARCAIQYDSTVSCPSSGYTNSGGYCAPNTCSGQTSKNVTGCSNYSSCKSRTSTYYTCTGCYSGYELYGSYCEEIIVSCDDGQYLWGNTCYDGCYSDCSSSTPYTDAECAAMNSSYSGCNWYGTSCSCGGYTYYGCSHSGACIENPFEW